MNNDTPQAECFNSCFLAFNLATAAKIADVLGREEEKKLWTGRAETVRAAVHRKYFNADDFSYSDRSMGNLALALLAEVPPAEIRDKVMQRLEDEILINCRGHVDVGIIGGALMFQLLRSEGRDDLIYSMTSQTDYPGWGNMRAHGATTLWEMWEPDLPNHSLCHGSFLYPGAWYIDGVIGSSWRHEDGIFIHEVRVPANTSATVLIPCPEGSEVTEPSGHATDAGAEGPYRKFEVPAGHYVFTCEP